MRSSEAGARGGARRGGGRASPTAARAAKPRAAGQPAAAPQVTADQGRHLAHPVMAGTVISSVLRNCENLLSNECKQKVENTFEDITVMAF